MDPAIRIAVILRRRAAAANLTVEELDGALLYWICHIQLDYFLDEVLTKGKSLPGTSPLLSLQPFLEDGLLRVGGRLDRALIPYESRHQIILPRKHQVTLLIITDHHTRFGHVGPDPCITQTTILDC